MHIEALESQSGRLSVACINSPTSVTISGDAVALGSLKERLDKLGIFCRKLKVDVAYHSFQMQEIADVYLQSLGTLDSGFSNATSQRDDSVAMVSSVTGTWTSTSELCQPRYWVQNMVSPVLFSDALLTALVSEADILVEVGPHSALQGPCREILRSGNKASDVAYTSLLVRKVPAASSLLEAVGLLYSSGYPLSVARVNRERFGKARGGEQPVKSLSNLPEYAFNHTKSYWHESRISKGFRFRRFGWHALLGVPDSDWNPLEARWRHIIRISELPWVEEHKVSVYNLLSGETYLTPGS